jgi:hypothetical protein
MRPIRIFISSVQQEFVQERAALREYLRSDPLFRRFYDVFLFEDVPAIDRRADEVYLQEVERCDIYVGLFGEEYGNEDEKGYSPTNRDYTSNGSVQVMLFADRLEVWNPGTLSPPLALAKLRKPHGSVPWNPLLAEPLYLTRYIERMGTGTGDMIKRCRDVGLDEPEFALTDGFVVTIRRKTELAFKAVGGIIGEVTGEVTGEVQRLLKILVGEMKRTDIQEALALRHENYFREAYLIPAITAGMIEMTIPDKPTSSKQKYRVTEKGHDLLTKQRNGAEDNE